jgi:hypothetical protein
VSAIRLLQHPQSFSPANAGEFLLRVPMILAAILFIPFLDMLRVFLLRLASRRPPFSADRSHIHHRLLDAGYSHLEASTMLITVSGTAQCIALIAPILPFPLFVVLLVLMMVVLTTTWHGKPRKSRREQTAIAPVALIPEQGESNLETLAPYPQFFKGFLRGNQLDSNHQAQKMQKMEEMEVPVK